MLGILIGLGLLAPLVARAADPPGPPLVGALGVGASTFWPGGHIASARVPAGLGRSACGTVTTCWEWSLALAGGGSRLRVAIDTPSREDSFRFYALDPTGAEAGSESNANQFNAELFVPEPAAGTWTIVVVPATATDATFRMRAKLEGATLKAAGNRRLLPNLRAVAPYEFGFVAPANPLNGAYPPDTVNPPLDVAGVHPLSCALDEMIEDGAQKCLRFTTGPMNTGEGSFDMRFTHVDDVLAGAEPRMWQHVHKADGTVDVLDGGTYSFHRTHAHYHYDDILSYELFKVVDPAAGTLVAAGVGHKSGFCPADQLIGEWSVFTQSPSGTFGEGDTAVGSCSSPTNGALGLSTGWGDVYRWQRPGQYVDFGTNTDGLYVVRATVDLDNRVLETDEDDNAAYGYLQIVGERVMLLERGRGLSPWDPAKEVVADHGAR